MIMSVSTLIIFSGAATPSSLVNLSIASSSISRFHGGSTASGQGSQLSPVAPAVEQRAVVRVLVAREQEGRRVVRQVASRDVPGDQLAGGARGHHAEAGESA